MDEGPDPIVRGRVVAAGRVIPDGVVAVRGSRVEWVGPADRWTGRLPAAAPEPVTVIPGLVDVHCHGGGGFGFPEADIEGCEHAARHHRSVATTTMLASLVSAPAEVLLRRVRLLADLTEAGEVAGVHLEGPFLSVRRCGAQDPANVIDGDPGLLEQLLEAGRGTVRSMTLAPETPHFAELVSVLRHHGAVPSLGHTDASSTATRDAVAAASSGGPLSATHLFNGMAPMHHRRPGAVAACLAAAARDELVVELIGDGVHLADETVSAVFDLVGPDRIALVSDAIAAAGMPDGRYPLGSVDVDVADGVARLAGMRAIAGGTSRLLDVVRRAVAHAGVDLAAAVSAASVTPARLLGLSSEIGDLAAGLRADLALLGDDLELIAVMRSGHWISQQPSTAGEGA
jgi:N-acetylglucosamine-6-phosphate deacetylase